MARVLLVDDLPANLVSMEAALAPLGAELVSAGSGGQALVAAREREFVVAVLDVMMPELDGIATARALKDLRPELPIIFLTAEDPSRDLLFEAYALGAVDYLVKPVDTRILRQKVSVFLQLQASADKLRAEEWRRAEEHSLRLQLQRQWTLLSELFSVAPAGVAVVCGPDAAVETMNAEFRGHWRLPESDGEGRALFELAPAARSRFGPLLEQAAGSGVPVGEREVEIALEPSSLRYVDVSVVPMASTKPGRLCIFCFDVTEKVLVRRAAERANRVKDEFLTMVSHELRTPLSAIVGWTSLLKGQRPPAAEMLDKALDVIERNARAQARIIEDILDVSRIMRGKLEIEFAPVDLATVVRDVLDAVAPEADRNELTIVASFGEDDCRTGGDAIRLRQLVGNLLSNAIKFTPRGGQVAVALERRGDALLVTVSDSGIGIDPRHLDSIFEPFHQADMSSTRQGKGVGLGLTIVRHLAELHGGGVRARSAGPGMGASLQVELPALEPLSAGATILEPPLPSAATPVRLGGKRVLIVEDGHDAREFFTLALCDAGADVRAAASAEAALELLRDFVPDAIVSDLAMPVHDGFWLISRVRALLPGITAIAVSATVPSPTEPLGKERGFDHYILKPIDARRLVEAVAQRLEGGEAAVQVERSSLG